MFMNKVNFLLSQNDVIGLLPELFLAISFLIVLIHGSSQLVLVTRLYTYIIPSVSRLTLVILFLSVILVCNNPVINQTLWGGTFILDYLGLSLKAFIIIIMFLCVLVSEDYLFLARIRAYEIFVFFIGICLSLCLLISSYDTLSIYLSMEFLSLIFYTLAAWKKDSGFSAEASLKYFILGSLASTFYLFGASLIYFCTGTTNLGFLCLLLDNCVISTIDILDYFNVLHFWYDSYKVSYLWLSIDTYNWFDFAPSFILFFGLLFLGSSLLFKIGAAPYHFWVADVYEGVPSLVSLIFAAVPKLVIFIVLSRLAFVSSWSFFFILWKTLFVFCGLLSFFFGCFGGLGEIKIKRIFAFSGIGHIGFICVSFSCGSLEGAQSMFFYLLIYMVTAVFMWTFVLCLNSSKKKWLSLVNCVGIVQSNPIFGLIICLMCFSLAGIPPFGGFFAKVFVFIALIAKSSFHIVIFAILTSVISAFYYLRIIKILFFEGSHLWFFFNPLYKMQALVLSVSSFIVLFFIVDPVYLYLFTYKLSLTLFAN
uniref:NADH dehydrogenase subunit 2 n=1 Tax=Protohalopteris sp. TaxID=2843287 RepID=A0A8F0FD12_9PHAE|nr:NADH dehydrogenase subunit 2 [Protohalopteris sp.]